MKAAHILSLFLFLSLSGCTKRPGDVLLHYEQSLVRADSLVQAGAVDSARTAALLSDLRREYSQAKELAGSEPVRMRPVNKWKHYFWSGFFGLAVGLNVWFSIRDLKFSAERKHRRYLVELSENEQRLQGNERERQELEECLKEMSLTDEEREEVHRSLVNLMTRGSRLHEENESLRMLLKKYEDQPMPREWNLLKKEGERARRLDGRVQALSSALVDGDEVVERLRSHPGYLADADWEYLQKLADRVYDGFTGRLTSLFPLLTPAHQRLCLLIRLRFTNAQIAAFTAVSPSSVSQQKFRLKKRMMEADETLFANGEAVDSVIEGC